MVVLSFDAHCYLRVNFVREFLAVIDPTSNQLWIKPMKKLVKLVLSSVIVLRGTAVVALGLVDYSQDERDRMRCMLNSKHEELSCSDWIAPTE